MMTEKEKTHNAICNLQHAVSTCAAPTQDYAYLLEAAKEVLEAYKKDSDNCEACAKWLEEE